MDGAEERETPVIDEDAEEEGFPVVGAVAAEEDGVGDDAVPLLADDRGAREGGWLGGEAHEDLAKDVLAVQREGRRQGLTAAAAAAGGHAPSGEESGIMRLKNLKICFRLLFSLHFGRCRASRPAGSENCGGKRQIFVFSRFCYVSEFA